MIASWVLAQDGRQGTWREAGYVERGRVRGERQGTWREAGYVERGTVCGLGGHHQPEKKQVWDTLCRSNAIGSLEVREGL